jgi:hypothetical protein
MDIMTWLVDLAGWMTHGDAAGEMRSGSPEPSRVSSEVLAWLLHRAELLAQGHGHLLGSMSAGVQEGVYIASCSRCGALAIVSIQPEHAGIRGTACSRSCRTRQAIHPLRSTAPLPAQQRTR